MTTSEQLIQLTEIISNLGKDISNIKESKKTASSEELLELEQLQQHLENTLQELKNQLQNLISEK
jgi:hypothetical protein